MFSNETYHWRLAVSESEIKRVNERERKWLEENNAVSAITGGPVEDLQGVPLPTDLLEVPITPVKRETTPEERKAPEALSKAS
jgi:hypothetical protein